MKRQLRKILSVVAAASMLVTAVPTGMFAEEPAQVEATTEDEAAKKAAEEAAAQKAAEEAAAVQKAAEEAAAQKAAEEAAAAQKAAEEAAAAQKAAEEAAAQKAAEEAAAQKAAEEAAKAQGGDGEGQGAPAEGASNPPAENAGTEQAQEQQKQGQAASQEGQNDQQQAAPAEGGESEALEAAPEQAEASAENQDGAKDKHAVTVEENGKEEEQALGDSDPVTITDIKWYFNDTEITGSASEAWNNDDKASKVSAKGVYGENQLTDKLTLSVEGEAKEPSENPYSVGFTPSAPTGYTFAENVGSKTTISITVTKREISSINYNITETYEYKGSAYDLPAPSVGDGVLGNGDSVGSVLKVVPKQNDQEVAFENSGTYDLVPELVNDTAKSHYNLTASAGTATIDPKPVTISWYWTDVEGTGAQASIPFDNKEHAFSKATFKDVSEEEKEITPNIITGPAGTVKEKGDYSASFTKADFVAEYPNYTISGDNAEGKLSIGKAEITAVTWTYNKAEAASVSVSEEWNSTNWAEKLERAVGTSTAGPVELQIPSVEAIEPSENAYTIEAAIKNTDLENYTFVEAATATKTFSITVTKRKIKAITGFVIPENGYTYTGSTQTIPAVKTATGSDGNALELIPATTLTLDELFTVSTSVSTSVGDTAQEFKDADNYTLTAAVADAYNGHYAFEESATTTGSAEIKRYPLKDDDITWTWAGVEEDNDSCSYDGKEHAPSATFKGLKDDGIIDIPCVVPDPATVKNVGDYTATITREEFEKEETLKNYTLVSESVEDALTIDQYEIDKDSITFTPPTVYNGAIQPVTAVFERVDAEKETLGETGPLSVSLNDEDITGTGVKNAGPYTVKLAFTGDDAINYGFADENVNVYKFTVARRSITVYPDALSKKFGTADVKPYTYDKAKLADNVSDPAWAGAGTIRSELPKDLLVRKPGELPGRYEYSVSPAYMEGGTPGSWQNYAITVDATTPYEIEKLKLTAEDKTITSRQGKFAFSTDMLSEKKAKTDSDVSRKLVITAEFPQEAGGVKFSTTLDDYISHAADGIAFTEKEGTVSIKDHTYSATKNKKALDWTGKLPAGTKLTLAVYGRNEALGEEWTLASNTATVEIVKQPVAMVWGSTADGVPAANYLSKEDKLTLTAVAQTVGEFSYDSRNEYVEVKYNGTNYYPTLDQQIKPVESNAGSTHSKQTASATFVDAMNLEFTAVSYEFTYDDSAFEIPSGNIQFHNRDKKISITLPEIGTIKSVTIPGADVKLTGGEGEKFEFDVSWSGQKLIPTGSGIQVTYTDQGGNEGRGSSSAARSTVSTPIRLQIRPEVNGRGYLTGRGTLVVSGTACSCEPLSISVAGMTKSTNVAARDVWADENGSFEVSFDMNRESLPERTSFNVSAEYTDVNGPGATLSASYDEFANAAAVASPIFRAMSFISGMAELDSTVILRIGEKSYEVPRDSFGHFALNNVDMMMPGDTFTVSVIDIAGNENNRATFTVPDADEPVTGSLGAIGQFFYDAGENSSSAYVATPIRVSDVTDAGMELPLLLGGSYKAGTMTFTKGAGGLTVQSALDPEVFVSEEDYTISGDTFYVYTGRPTLEQLRSRSGGTEYHFGDTIPAGSGDVLWIVDGRTLQMSISDVGGLEPYNFFALSAEEKQANPEKDREYASYVAFQEFSAAAVADQSQQADTQEQQA